MKVAFYLADQNPSRDRSLGITGYTDGLITALGKGSDLQLSALTSQTSYAPSLREMEIVRVPLGTANGLERLFVDNVHPAFWGPDADLWHYPKGFLPLTCRYRKPLIGTIHDVIVQHNADRYPESRNALAFAYWISVLKQSIPRFDAIVTISEFSQTAIRAFCDRYRLRCPPVRVTYEGFHAGSKAAKRVTKKDTVIHLASIQPHKRTCTLLGVWKRLQAIGCPLPLLKLVGTVTEADRVLARSLLPGVQLCERLSRPNLEMEIAEARALLLPSEIEGFGLPALEAYALGTPVAYVKSTAVEELLGEGTPGGFCLDDFDSFRNALEEVLHESPAAVHARAEAHSEKYSWDACGERTVRAYRECL
ncbi:MAG: glycosyltransferase [Verrucomicrobiota bacterium]|nr:glycosyltransferase [Verrucomicrobiota bacterium]